MAFGAKDEEGIRRVMDIANRIQKAIPEDSMGGEVMYAMALLIATGAQISMDSEDFPGVVAHTVEVMGDVFAGRIVTAFVQEH